VGRLYRIEGIMNQDIYMGILEEPMLHSADLMFWRGNRYFQQDTDPSTPPNVFVSGLLTMKSQRLSGQLNLLIQSHRELVVSVGSNDCK
jgi:hypothetical protein